MPHRCDGFQLVVDDVESVAQHTRTPNELHVGAEAGQIVEGQDQAPGYAGLTVVGRRGEQIENVHRHADQHEISQQVLVERLCERRFAGFVAHIRPDRRFH